VRKINIIKNNYDKRALENQSYSQQFIYDQNRVLGIEGRKRRKNLIESE
jgi:hypothetical protein